MDEVFYQSKRFFDLPFSEKKKLLRNKNYRGYTPSLDECLDPANQIHGDYKGGYYIGVEVPENDPDAQKPFYGPNVWLAADILPGWRETMEKYHQKALQVAKTIARIIALAFDLEENFFDQEKMLGKPIASLRLLHYEGRIFDPVKGIYGAGVLSDYGLMTLLATDDICGLQICKDKDAKPQKWEFVAPLRGAFIVNLGDMLERWSNCIFRSTLHRVLGNNQERYSIAYFVEPNHDCVVECLPTCRSQKNPPKYMLKLVAVDDKQCALVTLFDGAEALTGCSVSKFIESQNQKAEQSNFFKRLVLCYGNEFKFLVKLYKRSEYDRAQGRLIVQEVQQLNDIKDPIFIEDDGSADEILKKKIKIEKE